MFFTLLQIIGLLAVGFIVGRRGSWERPFFQGLSRMMVRVTFPLYFFTRISQTDPADVRDSMLFPVAALLIIGLSLALSFAIFRLLPLPRRERRVGVALASFGNAGMIPLTLTELFPLTLPFFAGMFGIATPSLYVGTYLLAETPLIWSLGNYLTTGKGRRPRIGELVTPPLIGILAGLFVLVSGLQPLLLDPGLPLLYLLRSFERLGQITFPVILLILGTMIGQLRPERESLRRLLPLTLAVSGIRFLLLPGIFFALAYFLLPRLPLSITQKWVLFLEMTIPPATNLSVMASQAGLNEDSVSFTILVGTVLYLFVLPVYVVGFFSLPGVL